MIELSIYFIFNDSTIYQFFENLCLKLNLMVDINKIIPFVLSICEKYNMKHNFKSNLMSMYKNYLTDEQKNIDFIKDIKVKEIYEVKSFYNDDKIIITSDFPRLEYKNILIEVRKDITTFDLNKDLFTLTVCNLNKNNKPLNYFKGKIILKLFNGINEPYVIEYKNEEDYF